MAVPAPNQRPAQIALALKQGRITLRQAQYLLQNPQANVLSPNLGFLTGMSGGSSVGGGLSGMSGGSSVGGGLSGMSGGQAADGGAINRNGFSLDANLRETNVDHPFMFNFANHMDYDLPSDFGSDADRTVLPVAPASFEYSTKNNAATFTSMSGRTFSHAGAEDLMKISFETFLPAGLTVPGVALPSYVYPAVAYDYFEPPEFVKLIQDAMAANQPVSFSINQSNGTPDGLHLIPPTAMTITDFTPSYNHGDGLDVKFSISLQTWNAQLGKINPNTVRYVTKRGDRFNCGNIALRQLGKISRYNEIKLLNSVVLLKDHAMRVKLRDGGRLDVDPALITVGTVLQLPAR